jgi:predicted permease
MYLGTGTFLVPPKAGLNQHGMIKNYFKIALRSLLRNKAYAFINIAGLALGIAICLVIFLVIRFELSFDDFHHNKDRVYRILTEFKKEGNYSAGVPFPLPAALRNDFPQLRAIAGIAAYPNRRILVLDNNGRPVKKFTEKKGVFFTEPGFFDIFDVDWLAGQPATALKDPRSAVLSRETAVRYFGSWEKAVGQTIKLDNERLLKVTGVLEDAPPNTDFQVKMIVPYSLFGFGKNQDWTTIDDAHQCYALLPPNYSVAVFDRQLRAFQAKYYPEDKERSLLSQPLRKVHFNSTTVNYTGRTVTAQHIRNLWLIAAFILLIACVNFVNLSTAQAVNRSKEIGVRKVLGSNKGQLRSQFLVETGILVMVAVMLAVLISYLALPFIRSILDIPLSFNILNAEALLFLLGITLAVTLLAGGYPSLVLSGFNPVLVLKSRLSVKSTKGISLRRALVVFQFVVAQGLMIATLIFIKQMDYFQKQPMGFAKEAIINVPLPNDSSRVSRLDYLRDQLAAVKGVRRLSFSNTTPADADTWWTPIQFDHAPKSTEFAVITKWVDDSYLSTYELKLAAGRDMTKTDSVREFLINETLAKKLGYANPEDILHKEINVWGGFAKGPIVGVVKDFHSSSFKTGMEPLFMSNVKKIYGMIGIKLTTDNMPAIITAIEKVWNNVFPDYVFEYEFLDDRINSFYKQEQQLVSLYQLFAAVAIFLSCLGLYGLASFMAVQRIKEVGIRKVLGASVANIMYMFSKEFVLMVGIAFAIASPLAWYFMQQWLEDFVYHIDIKWWIFIAGGGAAVIIALMTVSFHAMKAALSNPIKNLRTE